MTTLGKNRKVAEAAMRQESTVVQAVGVAITDKQER